MGWETAHLTLEPGAVLAVDPTIQASLLASDTLPGP